MEMLCSVASRVKSSVSTKSGSCGVLQWELCEGTLDEALDDLEGLWDRNWFCRASQHALMAVWVSIFAASADKGVVLACRANSSMLLVSLSHRYMSPF